MSWRKNSLLATTGATSAALGMFCANEGKFNDENWIFMIPIMTLLILLPLSALAKVYFWSKQQGYQLVGNSEIEMDLNMYTPIKTVALVIADAAMGLLTGVMAKTTGNHDADDSYTAGLQRLNPLKNDDPRYIAMLALMAGLILLHFIRPALPDGLPVPPCLRKIMGGATQCGF